jgi:hypothetical protein
MGQAWWYMHIVIFWSLDTNVLEEYVVYRVNGGSIFFRSIGSDLSEYYCKFLYESGWLQNHTYFAIILVSYLFMHALFTGATMISD